MTESKEIALFHDITEDKWPQIYGVGKVKDYYEHVREELLSVVPDLTTAKGRKAIASNSRKVSTSKTFVEKPGRAYLKYIKETKCKAIEEELREFVDKMDALRDEVRKPLTDYDNAEKARKEKRANAIRAIVDIGNGFIGGEQQPFGLLFSELELIKIDESFEEFEAQAHREKDSAKAKLDHAFAEHQKRQAEQEELDRLRAEAAAREQKDREERIAREAAENARIAAEKAAADERQRLADEQTRKDREAHAAIEKAEREKLEAENERLRQQQAAAQAAAKAKQDAIDAA